MATMADQLHPAAPRRSLEQRLQALAYANSVRQARAHLKQQLSNGSADISELLASPPHVARSAMVSELLRAVPKLGPARVAHLVHSCRISKTKTVAGLSERQRAELIARTRRSVSGS